MTVTRAIILAVPSTFDAPERKKLLAIDDELARAWTAIGENDFEVLKRRMQGAEHGQARDGTVIPPDDVEARLENFREAKILFDERETVTQAARAIEFACFQKLNNPARRLVEGALAVIEAAIKNPPSLPAPAPFVEWHVPFDGAEMFLGPMRKASASLSWELSKWSRASASEAHAWLRRGGLFPNREIVPSEK